MIILAVDPGEHEGRALFTTDLYPSGQLLAAWLAKPGDANVMRFDRLVIEEPAIYPGSRARPDSILRLVQNAQKSVDALGGKAEWVKPVAWKGTLPKNIHHPRILRTLGSVERNTFEAACIGVPKSLQHNMLDAVGLGLWSVGRKAK